MTAGAVFLQCPAAHRSVGDSAGSNAAGFPADSSAAFFAALFVVLPAFAGFLWRTSLCFLFGFSYCDYIIHPKRVNINSRYAQKMCVFIVHFIRLYCVYINGIIKKGGDNMPIRYKFDVLESLKKAGYSYYKIRQEKILGERVLSRLRHQESVSYDVLALLCKLLNCQVGDILEYVPDNDNTADSSKEE